MKVGLIVEGTDKSGDKKICEYIINRFCDTVSSIDTVPLGSKPNLKANCGETARLLLAGGCDYVVIMFDLYPAWREDGGKPDCIADCAAARQSLRNAGVADNKAFLVCVAEELESWLLADGRALSAFLSHKTHKVKIADRKKPDTIKSPKTQLTKIIQQNGGGRYNEGVHGLQIVQNLPDLSKVKNSPTFCRFILKITGVPLP